VSDDETHLVRLAQQGNQNALVEIYDLFYQSVFTYIFHRVSDQEIAEDLTSEVFVRMVDKIKNFNPQGRPILAWLYTIARNLTIDFYRSHRDAESLSSNEDLIAEDRSPYQVVEERLAQEALGRALGCLTEDQRWVVILKFIEGRDIAEVATILGKNERAVRSLQHRALAALSQTMARERYDEPQL
jgi:RNA polymerase sigma-70 factor (ECF subfamily)